ncbi:MAG: NAD(P)-dependent oxidoreductase [Phycisphaerales bacterium]
MTRPIVIQTEELSASAHDWLASRCDVRVCSVDDPKFASLLSIADALVIRTYTKVDRALLAQAPKLRVVGRAGVGLENVDVQACAARGVQVLNTPDANSDAVAEYVFTLLLRHLRPCERVTAPTDAPLWKSLRARNVAQRQVCDLTFGVLGCGRIGSRVARIAGAFGARVIFHDLADIPVSARFGAQPVTRTELARESDVLSVHVDPRPDNHKLINRDLLGLLKSDAILINTSRGVIADTLAVRDYLIANPRAAALLDVHDPEPIGANHPLLGVPNAFLSPHIAAATMRAHENMSWVVRDVWDALNG